MEAYYLSNTAVLNDISMDIKVQRCAESSRVPWCPCREVVPRPAKELESLVEQAMA
eukprot:Skav215249  [mRNA]  locus=scaffold811:239396:242484:- [translate_table: standard]